MSKKIEIALCHCMTLLENHGISLPVGVKAVHDVKADKMNAKQARSFAYVVRGVPRIYYSEALTALPLGFVCGILLHELVHIHLDNKPGDPEVNVDEFITAKLPRAKYTYDNCVYVWNGNKRTANNIECVKGVLG